MKEFDPEDIGTLLVAKKTRIAVIKVTHTNPIKVYPDGDQWCALLGENLQEGEAGFGSTPIEAIQALIKQL